MITHTLFTFKSVDNLPTEGELGVVYVLKDGSTYLYSNEWEQISSATDNSSPKMLPTNCKNCGATLHGYKCEYCGTTYN